jgi:hypothetical protein
VLAVASVADLSLLRLDCMSREVMCGFFTLAVVNFHCGHFMESFPELRSPMTGEPYRWLDVYICNKDARGTLGVGASSAGLVAKAWRRSAPLFF